MAERSAPRHEGRVAGLYTRRFGPWPPSDAVVVMIHGLALSGRYFTPLARSLAAAGRTVLVPDLPGNVRSRRAGRPAPDVAESLEALLRWQAAAAIGSCVLVANSVGCQVTTALAAEHPRLVERMVLIGPAPDATALSSVRQLLRLLTDVPKEPLSLLAVAAADYLVTGAARFVAGFHHARQDAAGPFLARLRRIEAPTLVLRGSDDRVAPQPWGEEVTSRPAATARHILQFLSTRFTARQHRGHGEHHPSEPPGMGTASSQLLTPSLPRGPSAREATLPFPTP